MNGPPDAPRTARQPLDIALIAVIRAGAARPEVLLTKRPDGVHLGGYWELPGGKVEPSDGEDGPAEAPRLAACREAREELTLTIHPERLEACGCSTHSYSDRLIHFHLFVYRISEAGMAVIEQLLQPRAWVGIDELHLWPLPPANAAVNELLVARLTAAHLG